MSRNTHDRQRDHQGVDLPSNITLDTAIERYPEGTSVEAIIRDLAVRQTAMERYFHIFALNASAVIRQNRTGSFTAGAVLQSATQFGFFSANAVIQ